MKQNTRRVGCCTLLRIARANLHGEWTTEGQLSGSAGRGINDRKGAQSSHLGAAAIATGIDQLQPFQLLSNICLQKAGRRLWFAVLFGMVAIWRAIQNKTANSYVIEIPV